MNQTIKTCQLLGASLALFLASTSTSQAVAVTILNPSFESPGGGPATYTPATDWVGSNFTEISTEVGLNSGGNGLRYNGEEGGSTTQVLGVSFLSNTRYTLTLAIGNRVTGNPTGTATFGLTANGTDLPISFAPFTVVAPAQVPGGTFRDFTYTITTGAVAPTGNVGIRLGALSDRALFDNVRLDASLVPEPSATLFALIGGLLIARRRR